MTEQIPLGFTFAGVACGIKKTGASDLALIVSDRPCSAAAVFTQNKFPAASVLYDRELVAENAAGLRGVAINAGCANACTGEAGLADAAKMAALAEDALGLPPRSCAVMSTGVIGPRLPMDQLATGIRAAAGQLGVEGWEAASRAIMTTDTRPKVAFRQVGGVRLLGMCKGAGMIHPNMATMLCAIVTDVAIAPDALAAMLRQAVDVSFNCTSVDGDTSTNDTVLLLANGAAGVKLEAGSWMLEAGSWKLEAGNWKLEAGSWKLEAGSWMLEAGSWKLEAGNSESSTSTSASTSAFASAFVSALTSLCTDLAQQIVRDGEGATKFITVRVEGAASDADARIAAKAVANSPLVKTAFYGGDANWGRILAAVGYSGAAVDPARADLWIAAGGGVGAGEQGSMGETKIPHTPAPPHPHTPTRPHSHPLQLVRGGQPLAYSEQVATAIFAEKEITVIVNLGLAAGQATVWTCDLSHDYVSINGHYRT